MCISDTRCLLTKFRAAGCTLLPKRILRCLSGCGKQTFLYEFRGSKACLHIQAGKELSVMEGIEEREPNFAAFVGIDWADRKHAWALQVQGALPEHGYLDH